MRRDMDLIRALLLKLEAHPAQPGEVFLFEPGDPDVQIEGVSAEQIGYHLDQLREVGWIDCPGSQPMLGITFRSLTWAGHDFLDSVRDPEIWAKTKGGVEAAKGFTLGLVADLAKGLVKKQIEKYTGVEL